MEGRKRNKKIELKELENRFDAIKNRILDCYKKTDGYGLIEPERFSLEKDLRMQMLATPEMDNGKNGIIQLIMTLLLFHINYGPNIEINLVKKGRDDFWSEENTWKETCVDTKNHNGKDFMIHLVH